MNTKEPTSQTRQEVGAGLHEAAHTVTERGKEWAEKAKGTARDAGAAADLYVHEYAWTRVVLIAAAAGVLGYLWGARRR